MFPTNTKLIAFTVIPLLTACGVDSLELPTIAPTTHTVSFTGQVYDGASGQRVNDYEIQLLVGDTFTVGTFNESTPGRFLLGPTDALDDYTVNIIATGYRDFWSHNAFVNPPPGGFSATVDSHQFRHFDAYVFPTDLETAASVFNIRASDHR